MRAMDVEGVAPSVMLALRVQSVSLSTVRFAALGPLLVMSPEAALIDPAKRLWPWSWRVGLLLKVMGTLKSALSMPRKTEPPLMLREPKKLVLLALRRRMPAPVLVRLATPKMGAWRLRTPVDWGIPKEVSPVSWILEALRV